MAHESFVLRDGTPVVFETDSPAGLQPAGALGDQLRNVQGSLEASLASIQKAALTIQDAIVANLSRDLAQVEVSFAIKASAEVNGFVFAKGGAEGNCGIKLVWKRRD